MRFSTDYDDREIANRLEMNDTEKKLLLAEVKQVLSKCSVLENPVMLEAIEYLLETDQG